MSLYEIEITIMKSSLFNLCQNLQRNVNKEPDDDKTYSAITVFRRYLLFHLVVGKIFSLLDSALSLS